MKEFNVTGICIPEEHYMVDISNKLDKIIAMIEKHKYFTINRARQYGKTTTFSLLEERLIELGYVVASISFEGLDDTSFADPKAFCHMFMRQIKRSLDDEGWFNSEISNFDELNGHITKLCKHNKYVLLIDEVDKSSNNMVFLYFLGLLRKKYLVRNKRNNETFISVVLAGVHDIKNIKYSMVEKGNIMKGDNEGSENSPWNIAETLRVDMSFNPSEISTMLCEFESVHHMNMNIDAVGKEIFRFTNGYPFLVSRICKCLNEELDNNFTSEGVREAVNIIIRERNTLFDDIVKNMENYEGLYNLLKEVIFTNFNGIGSILNKEVTLGLSFGIFVYKDRMLIISNPIFETVITDYIVEKNRAELRKKTGVYYMNKFITNERLNLTLIIQKFSDFMYQEYKESDINFIEQNGRLLLHTSLFSNLFISAVWNGYYFFRHFFIFVIV